MIKFITTGLAIILFLSAPGWSAGFTGAGFSFDQQAGNPGFAWVFGTQEKLADDLYMRAVISKVNWGCELDFAGAGAIKYVPVDWLIFKQLGIHAAGNYGLETKEFSIGFGGELVWPVSKDFDILLGGDYLIPSPEADPNNYFQFSLGLVLFK
jgi:hypothetical protein